MFRDKRGWIKIVEAFFSVLLIGGIIIVAVGLYDESENPDISSGVFEDEMAMLKAVQLNDDLRASILGIAEGSLPLSMDDTGFPEDVKTELGQKNPGYLICDAKICEIEQECLISNTASADIYVSQATIFANLETYNPRKLVLSCVVND